MAFSASVSVVVVREEIGFEGFAERDSLASQVDIVEREDVDPFLPKSEEMFDETAFRPRPSFPVYSPSPEKQPHFALDSEPGTAVAVAAVVVSELDSAPSSELLKPDAVWLGSSMLVELAFADVVDVVAASDVVPEHEPLVVGVSSPPLRLDACTKDQLNLDGKLEPFEGSLQPQRAVPKLVAEPNESEFGPDAQANHVSIKIGSRREFSIFTHLDIHRRVCIRRLHRTIAGREQLPKDIPPLVQQPLSSIDRNSNLIA